jgi:hypothetical protein
MEEAASIADGAELGRREIVKLNDELIHRGPGLHVAIIELLNVLVETLEAYFQLTSMQQVRDMNVISRNG